MHGRTASSHSDLVHPVDLITPVHSMPEFLVNAKHKQSFRANVPMELNDALRDYIRLTLLKKLALLLR